MKKGLHALFISFTLFLAWPPQTAQAQMCDTIFEMITTLRPPVFGFPTVWDAKFGKRGSMVQLSSGLPRDDGTILAIGRRLSQEDFKPEDVLVAALNRRGRALIDNAHNAKDGEDPVKIIALDKGYVAISNIRGGAGRGERQVRLSWFDEEAAYKRDRVVRDGHFDYEATGLVNATDGNGFIAILHAVNRTDPEDENSVLMRFTAGGEIVWRRAYRPGIPNALYGLLPVDETHYMAAGRIRLEDGRMAGWAMKLGRDGTVHWQRTYPRGGESTLRDATVAPFVTVNGQGVILSGDSLPLDGGPVAAWVLAIDPLGEPLWQRYYRRPDAALRAQWLESYPDGRTAVIINAAALPGEEVPDHIRMLTLSPRGIIIQDEAYHEGRGAQGRDYVPGWNGERIITGVVEDPVGSTESDEEIVVVGLVPDEEAPEDAEEGDLMPPKTVEKGWVFIATALDPYQDPCAVTPFP